MVEDGAKSGQALVASGGKGGTYAYQVQRVFRTEAGGQTLELDGLLSEPVRLTSRIKGSSRRKSLAQLAYGLVCMAKAFLKQACII